MKLVISGNPGVGKTSFVQTLLSELPFKAGGIVTQEIRVMGRRVGFNVRDLATGREGILAHLHHAHGPKLGRYRVHTQDLEEVGAAAIEQAVDTAELIVIDEVGPMELTSPRFIIAVRKALESDVRMVLTVHRTSKHALAYTARRHADLHLRLSQNNRARVLAQARELFLRQSASSDR